MVGGCRACRHCLSHGPLCSAWPESTTRAGTQGGDALHDFRRPLRPGERSAAAARMRGRAVGSRHAASAATSDSRVSARHRAARPPRRRRRISRRSPSDGLRRRMETAPGPPGVAVAASSASVDAPCAGHHDVGRGIGVGRDRPDTARAERGCPPQLRLALRQQAAKSRSPLTCSTCQSARQRARVTQCGDGVVDRARALRAAHDHDRRALAAPARAPSALPWADRGSASEARTGGPVSRRLRPEEATPKRRTSSRPRRRAGPAAGSSTPATALISSSAIRQSSSRARRSIRAATTTGKQT